MPVLSEDLTLPFTLGSGGVAQQLYEKLAPWMTPDLQILCEAIGAMTEPLAEILEEEGYPDEAGWVPAYGKLMNPEICPAAYLPWLGNFVGVSIPIGTPEAAARALIEAESGRERCTRAAMESAIGRTLAPGTTFEIRERVNLAGESDPYGFVVTIKGKGIIQTWFGLKGSWEGLSGSWENLSGNEGLVREAILSQKPAGLVFWIILTEGTPWIDLEGSWEQLTGTWEHIA